MKTITTSDGVTITITDDKFQELLKENKPEFNALGQSISSEDCVFIHTDFTTGNDNRYTIERANCFTYWECFKTKEQAKAFDDLLQAVKEIWDWKALNDKYFSPDWIIRNQYRYYLYYNHDKSKWVADISIEKQKQFILPFFGTQEVANKCIKECKKQLNIIKNFNK